MGIAGIKYPLSGTMGVGLDDLKRLGLTAEATSHKEIGEYRPFAELLVSSHGPYVKDGMRLNVGAAEDDFRQMSIDTIIGHIDAVSEFPKVRQVNLHFAPKHWFDESQVAGREGDYGRMVDAFQQIAAFAAERDIEIVLENGNAYWAGVPEDTPPEQVDWTGKNQAFGSSPEEWIGVCEDVGRPNVGLCLDSSHTCTYSQTHPESDRERVIMSFLSRPELIRHVHWSDNYLYDARGRSDSHASVGRGTLPTEMHRAIKGLDATILLEHFYSIEELEEELEYIDRL